MNPKSKSAILLTLIATIGTGAAMAAQPTDEVTSDSSGNTAMGDSALHHLGTPDCEQGTSCYNTAAGAGALYSNSVGSDNAAFGFQALNSNTTGVFNSAMGYRALFMNQGGNFNSAFGQDALYYNTSGGWNSAFGMNALSSNTSGNNNAAFGTAALGVNNTGANNAAFGYAALEGNVSGTDNTGLGYSALQYTQASYNTGIGSNALISNRSGAENVALGYEAMLNSSNGNDNTAIGVNALAVNTAGSNNTVLGYAAGMDITGSNNVDIANSGSVSDNGVIRIGTANKESKTFVAGIENAKITGNAVYVTSSGQLGVLASSERYKDRIETMGGRTDKMQLLRPVTFHLKSDPTGDVQYGLIAEEVVKIYPELVIRDDAGKIQGVRYDELAPMLLNEMQKQRQEMAMQNIKIQAQEAKFAKLVKINEALLSAVADLGAVKDRRLARAN